MRYLGFIAAVAVGASAPLMPHLTHEGRAWIAFGVLSALAALSQLLAVETTANQAYYTTTVFLVAAALLLPPELVALVAIVAHVPEWIKYRYPWYIQTFNICNYVVATMAAWAVAEFGARVDVRPLPAAAAPALAGLLASVSFVLLNHATLAEMLRRARGHAYSESGLFGVENLATDFVLAALGVCLAGLWQHVPALAIFAIAPLVLIHRSLSVPRLEAEARLDAKTGLYNARHLQTALCEEIDRAQRFGRPLSVLVADLDLLRHVNNTYGHLAGDAVLEAVADIFRSQLRSYDVATRFGGEEFAILLPETSHENALAIAERIRATVAATPFQIPGHDKAIAVTLSIGVASYDTGDTPDALMHRADLALYQAKDGGRNRVATLVDGFRPIHLAAVQTPPVATAEGGARDARNAAPAPRSRRYNGHERRQSFRVPERAPLPEKLTGLRRSVAARGAVGPAIAAFVGGVVVAALVLVAREAHTIEVAARDHAWQFAFLAAVSVVLQVFLVPLHGAGTVSVSGIGVLATGFVLGVGPAMVAALLAAITLSIKRRAPLHRALFDMSNYVLAAGAAAVVYRAVEHADPGVASPQIAAFVAGIAFTTVNVGLLSCVMAVSEGRSPGAIWSQRFRWGMLYYLAFGPIAYASTAAYDRFGPPGAVAFLLPPLLVLFSMRQYLDRTRASFEELKIANAELEQANAELESSRERARRTHLATIAALSKAMEAKDCDTGGHTERVSSIAVALAHRLGFESEELEAIEIGSLLHDIGKIGIPEQILRKPGPLTDEEWSSMRTHPIISDYILSEVDVHPFVRAIARWSHERLDGCGYPDGLHGDAIPLPARIVLVADALDALTSERPYRAARDVDSALAEIRAHAGTQFCPAVVAALEELYRAEPGLLRSARPGRESRATVPDELSARRKRVDGVPGLTLAPDPPVAAMP